MRKYSNKNIIYRKVFFLIFFFVIISALLLTIYATSFLEEVENPSFELIDRDSGLSNLSVSSIIQDKNGFLWFGTQSGLNRYDGREMKVIRNNPFQKDGLIHNLIQTMFYDNEKNEIWIGTYQGISRYTIDDNSFENFSVEDSGLSNPVVIAITKDNEGNMWFGTMEGLNKLDVSTGKIEQFKISGNVVRSLIIDSKNRLLIGTYEGLYYFDNVNNKIVKIKIELPSPYVMVIKEFEKGILTLGLWDGGVAKVNLSNDEVEITKYDDNRVYSLIKTTDDILWVGTWGGGLFATDKKGRTYNFSDNYPIIYSMYQDETDILWIGTNGGGIYKVNPRKINYVELSHDADNPKSLSQGKINAIFEDSKGNQWFAIYNNGLNRYNPKTKVLTKFINDPDNSKSLPNNQIIDVLGTEDEKILFGTGDGLVEYDMNTEEFTKKDFLKDKVMVYALAKSSENELWIGTYEKGVYYYNEKTNELINYRNKAVDSELSDNLIYDILVDSKERVWVATNNGLNLMKQGTDEFISYHKIDGNYNQLASNTIRTLFEDTKGRVWIGMVGGGIAFYQEDTDAFKSFTEEDGLSSNVVVGILEDNEGRIWASTLNGLSIINPESDDIFVLTPDDGIGGWEFNTGNFKSGNGELLFGGIHGITSIPSEIHKLNIQKPKVYITNVDLFQNSIDPNRQIFNNMNMSFDYEHNFLGFKFVSLDYDTPEKTKFLIKLEGLDNDWIDIGTRDYISYSNIAPGDYKLMVIAKTAKNIQSDPVIFNFKIEKPWFATGIALFSYLILLFAIIFGIFKIREGYILNKKNSELAQINRKLEIANDELENMSMKDALTGLYNRRFFNIEIEEKLNMAKRSKVYLTLLMIDIDKFKDINDNYGHLIGDKLLENISQAIIGILPRSTDTVTRYGGDEFAIILYDTDSEGALKVANDINSEINKVNGYVEFAELNIISTVSMGLVCVVPEQKLTVNVLIKEADNALYRAKQEGRNRISIVKIDS